jgi:hypothetical protein
VESSGQGLRQFYRPSRFQTRAFGEHIPSRAIPFLTAFHDPTLEGITFETVDLTLNHHRETPWARVSFGRPIARSALASQT